MVIEIVDLPSDSMVIFHSYVNVYQRVSGHRYGHRPQGILAILMPLICDCLLSRHKNETRLEVMASEETSLSVTIPSQETCLVHNSSELSIPMPLPSNRKISGRHPLRGHPLGYQVGLPVENDNRYGSKPIPTPSVHIKKAGVCSWMFIILHPTANGICNIYIFIHL